jgi:putative endonuclease
MKVLCVYMLKCSDDSIYVGVTNNIERRLKEHSNAHNTNSYTARRLPVQLVYKEFIHSPRTAIEREKQLKRWSSKKKMALINGDYKRLVVLAKKNFRR